MCQLLGMNCNVPTDICFSFQGFCRRGGDTDEHTDGWGIGFFEDRGCRVFLDTHPSAESPIAELVRTHPIRSMNVIAHVRKATIGGATLLHNTHPFQRELWGQHWVFAHNGDLYDFAPSLSGSFMPTGDTDSEQAFCLILDNLRLAFGHQSPPLAEVYQNIQATTQQIRKFGIFNFLLSNGQCMVAHCSTNLCYIIRQAPFDTAHLVDDDISIDFRQVTSPSDRVAVIATTPLTDNENWHQLSPDSLVLFTGGKPEITNVVA